MKSIEEIIGEYSFFKGLSQDKLEIFASCAKKIAIKTGDYIFKAGEDAKEFYLILNGFVSLEVHEINIQILGRGEILGWSWQFPPYKWNFDAKVLEDAELLVFDTNLFFAKCNINLVFAYEIQKRFSKIMLERLQATRHKLIETIQDKTLV